MAFGDVLDFASASADTGTDPWPVDSGDGLSVSVSASDLIIAVLSKQTNLQLTDVYDNLGNAYTAQNAGTDAGIITGRMFYAIITAPGTLNSVNFDFTGLIATDDLTAGVVVYQGPFLAIDKNPANSSGDTTNPITCPASGTLSQAVEVVVSWIAGQHDTSAPTSMGGGGTLDLAAGETAGARLGIGHTLTNSTDSITHTFTFPSLDPGGAITGTATFTQATAGQPYDLHEAGVQFVNPHHGGQNFQVWRKAFGWRKSLSGLLLPPKPQLLRSEKQWQKLPVYGM